MRQVLACNLMERVLASDNLNQAYLRVKKNKGAAGVDGMSISEALEYLRLHGTSLRESLREGRYRPQPVRSVEIPKPRGGTRKLGIPTVVDRIIQQALLQVLQPILDTTFSCSSFGYRPSKSAHDAVLHMQDCVKRGHDWVVDVDLESFFDTVNHDILMRLLSEKIGDKSVLRLIRRYLQAGLMKHGVCSRSEQGVPQGGPLSPLLSNVLLNEADRELERRGHLFCRYADDVQVYVKSREAGERILKSLTEYFARTLHLKVNEVKSDCKPVSGAIYLGYGCSADGFLLLPEASYKRLQRKLRSLTKRRRGGSFERIVSELNRVLIGWCNYFRYARCRQHVSRMDKWLRRRLRCLRLSRCKRVHTVKKFLTKQGVPSWRSWLLALSGKGWWRMSGTPQANEAMPIKWFSEQGLVSLLERYTLLQTLEEPPYTQVRTVV